jgi:hypothetical protein
MSRTRIDITGARFGRLTVIEVAPRPWRSAHVDWVCRCDCGARWVVASNRLRTGHTRSCGCLQRDEVRERTMADPRWGGGGWPAGGWPAGVRPAYRENDDLRHRFAGWPTWAKEHVLAVAEAEGYAAAGRRLGLHRNRVRAVVLEAYPNLRVRGAYAPGERITRAGVEWEVLGTNERGRPNHLRTVEADDGGHHSVHRTRHRRVVARLAARRCVVGRMTAHVRVSTARRELARVW